MTNANTPPNPIVVEINGKTQGYCPKHDRLLEDWQLHCPSCFGTDPMNVQYQGIYGVHHD